MSTFYRLRLATHATVDLDADAADTDHFAINGALYEVDDDDDFNESGPIGAIGAWRVLAGRIGHDNLGAAMDDEDLWFAQAFDALSDAGLVEHAIEDVLVVSELALEPEHRGRNLGLTMVRALLRTHGTGCQLVVLDVRPNDYLDAHDEEGRQTLESHFARIGALRLPTPGFMLLDLWRRNDALDSGQFLPKGAPVRMFNLETWLAT